MHAVVMVAVMMAAPIVMAVHARVMAPHVPAVMADEAPVAGPVGDLGGDGLGGCDRGGHGERCGLRRSRGDDEPKAGHGECRRENSRHDKHETRSHRDLLLTNAAGRAWHRGESAGLPV